MLGSSKKIDDNKIMKISKSMTYLIIGMVLTAIGIVFTVVGTFKQGKESQEFQVQVIETQKKSIELSEKLAKISEDKFNQLTRPVMNVVQVEENLDLELNSYFRVFAKNTGNNDCFNVELIIDRHTSPMISPSEIERFVKIPKGATVEFQIRMFKTDFMLQVAEEQKIKDFKEKFYNRFMNEEMSIIVLFHIEYDWNGEKLKSSQYYLIKSKNQRSYVSSSENYIEKED